VLEGEVALVNEKNEWTLAAGWCVGLPVGAARHHLENRSSRPAIYLEVDGRSASDRSYSFDDLVADVEGGTWHFMHSNGKRYER
jgi:uncharacterized cupin superfamily protein